MDKTCTLLLVLSLVDIRAGAQVSGDQEKYTPSIIVTSEFKVDSDRISADQSGSTQAIPVEHKLKTGLETRSLKNFRGSPTFRWLNGKRKDLVEKAGPVIYDASKVVAAQAVKLLDYQEKRGGRTFLKRSWKQKLRSFSSGSNRSSSSTTQQGGQGIHHPDVLQHVDQRYRGHPPPNAVPPDLVRNDRHLSRDSRPQGIPVHTQGFHQQHRSQVQQRQPKEMTPYTRGEDSPRGRRPGAPPSPNARKQRQRDSPRNIHNRTQLKGAPNGEINGSHVHFAPNQVPPYDDKQRGADVNNSSEKKKKKATKIDRWFDTWPDTPDIPDDYKNEHPLSNPKNIEERR